MGGLPRIILWSKVARILERTTKGKNSLGKSETNFKMFLFVSVTTRTTNPPPEWFEKSEI
jgi:hypothetical protein